MTLKIKMISGVLFTASLLVSSNLLAQWGSPWGGNNNGAIDPSSNITGVPGPAQGVRPTDPVGYGRRPMPYRSTNGTGIPGPAQGARPTDPVGYGYGRPPMPYRSNGPQYGGQNGTRSSKGWPISQGGN